jgi:hypothetical protein
VSHKLKEWKEMRVAGAWYKFGLMLDRAEDLHARQRTQDALVYLTRIWNALDGGFYPLSGHDENTCNRGEVDDNLVDDLWWEMVGRCPWAFFTNTDGHIRPNSLKFTYREDKNAIEPLQVSRIYGALRANVFWPNTAKQLTMDDYVSHRINGDSKQEAVAVDTVVQLSNEDFDLFCGDLLRSRDWLRGLGGYRRIPGHEGYTTTRLCVLVYTEREGTRTSLYVDPSGYDYARYVGWQ